MADANMLIKELRGKSREELVEGARLLAEERANYERVWRKLAKKLWYGGWDGPQSLLDELATAAVSDDDDAALRLLREFPDDSREDARGAVTLIGIAMRWTRLIAMEDALAALVSEGN